MKFRRFLAALLGSLMIVSMMSFTANVSAAENGVIKEFIFAKNADMTPPVENGARATKMYDEENDIVFFRVRPKTGNVSVYVNSGSANVPFTEEQAAEDDNYLVYYARTNIDTDAETPGVQCTAPTAMQYTCTWSPTLSNNPTLTQVTADGFGVSATENWQKFCFKVQSKYEKDGQTYLLSKWAQVAFGPVGLKAVMSGDKMFTYNEDPYYDVAGYTVVDSLEAAIAYDFEVEAQAEKITVSFDMGDGSDLIEKTVLAGTDAKVEFPEVAERQDYLFLGWATDAEGANIIEDTANVVAPNEDTTYYAIWQDNTVPVEFTLDSLTINGSDASTFGVSDINAEEIVVTLPYGWEKLEEYGVMPEVVPTATSPAIATYVAPETLDDAGKIVFTQGNSTGEVAIKFVIGAAPEAKTAGTNKVQAGVYSTTGIIYLPDDSEINNDSKIRAVGLVTESNVVLDGVVANKFTPVYKGSELDGTKVSDTEYYTHNRTVNLEGYNALGTIDFESYNVYRALVYYDTGVDGKFDIEVNPYIWYQGSLTTGTMKSNDVARRSPITSVANFKGDRWEYIYFTKTDVNKVLYGQAVQPVFSFFAKDSATKAKDFTDDVFYFAEVTILPELDEFVQYKPMGVTAVAVDGDIPGSVTGLTEDMEMLVDDEWVAITEVEGYADGVLSNLEVGEYTFRYAATEELLASEGRTVEILPGAVTIEFDAQNGDAVIPVDYEIGADVEIPEDPSLEGYFFKGWAEKIDGEVVDLTGLKATEDKTYYAVWEKIEVVYVKSSAETSGNGYSADAPVKTLAEAAAFAYNFGGTIVVMDDVAWPSKLNGTSNNNHVNEDIVITSVDPVTGTDYPGALVQTSSLNFAGDYSKKITIKDIEIASWRFGSAADKWQYINFNGHPIEFDNVTVRKGEVPVGYAVGQDAVVDGDAKEIFFPVHMRAQGEQSSKGYGHQIVMGDVEFTSIVLGGKVAYEESTGWYKSDIDLVFTGNSNTTLGVANDTSYSTVEGVRYFHYGRFNNVKLLFETSPKSIYMSNISGIDGTYRVIANNGAVVTIPSFTYVRSDDKTSNADGSPYTADLTPKGGFWKINSAEGGRVDFTEEDNVFAVTTDATYIVVTNKADGTSRKIRVADGVEGDANLFDEDGAYLLTLEAGEYDIAYTDEAVKVTVVFENGDNDETYEVAKGEKAVFAGEVEAPAGKVLAGWQTEDGEIVTTNNEYTADTYSEEDIVLYPVFADDSNAPYYYIYGEYDKINAKYTVDVKIANGKFTAGTFGLEYNTLAIELADDGIVMGEGVQNYLGNDPEITKVEPDEGSGLAMIVWNAASGIVDASENEVTLATFTFDVIDTDEFDVFFGGDVDGWFNVSSYDYNNWEFDEVYEKYYNGEYYLVSPENTSDNPYAVDYVPAYFGEIVDKEKSYEKASITFNVTFDSKEGATDANVGELIVYNDDTDDIVYTIDAQGNEEATVTQVVEEFYVGDTVEFYVHKNGYMAVDVFGDDAITAEDGLVINITLLAGDIKGNTEDCCGDGEITLADFVRVVRAFDETARDEYRALVDINEDGAVTVADLAIIKANFNKTSDDNTVEYGE